MRAIIHHDVGIMMTRTQLSFEPEMLQRARERAGQLGVSLAEYVRRAVAADLQDEGCVTDPSAVFDLGSSTGSNIGRDKDMMLGEAFGRRTR